LFSFTISVCANCFQGSLHHTASKKADLDSTDARSYWPISNLSVMSKLFERLVAHQLLDYFNAERLLPEMQSASIRQRQQF